MSDQLSEVNAVNEALREEVERMRRLRGAIKLLNAILDMMYESPQKSAMLEKITELEEELEEVEKWQS
jgi:hypothetical protein